MSTIIPLADASPAAVESLLDAAFGVDRRRRTAYRLREGVDPLPKLTLGWRDGGDLIGSIQCWPVRHRGDDGTLTRLILVGPVAVRPGRQGEGIGRALTHRVLRIADRAASPPQMLIGDPDYYGRFFGFTAASTDAWRLPGPFEPHRLLARGAAPSAPGSIEPDR